MILHRLLDVRVGVTKLFCLCVICTIDQASVEKAVGHVHASGCVGVKVWDDSPVWRLSTCEDVLHIFKNVSRQTGNNRAYSVK
jgi:hypothetical protein